MYDLPEFLKQRDSALRIPWYMGMYPLSKCKDLFKQDEVRVVDLQNVVRTVRRMQGTEVSQTGSIRMATGATGQLLLGVARILQLQVSETHDRAQRVIEEWYLPSQEEISDISYQEAEEEGAEPYIPPEFEAPFVDPYDENDEQAVEPEQPPVVAAAPQNPDEAQPDAEGPEPEERPRRKRRRRVSPEDSEEDNRRRRRRPAARRVAQPSTDLPAPADDLDAIQAPPVYGTIEQFLENDDLTAFGIPNPQVSAAPDGTRLTFASHEERFYTLHTSNVRVPAADRTRSASVPVSASDSVIPLDGPNDNTVMDVDLDLNETRFTTRSASVPPIVHMAMNEINPTTSLRFVQDSGLGMTTMADATAEEIEALRRRLTTSGPSLSRASIGADNVSLAEISQEESPAPLTPIRFESHENPAWSPSRSVQPFRPMSPIEDLDDFPMEVEFIPPEQDRSRDATPQPNVRVIRAATPKRKRWFISNSDNRSLTTAVIERRREKYLSKMEAINFVADPDCAPERIPTYADFLNDKTCFDKFQKALNDLRSNSREDAEYQRRVSSSLFRPPIVEISTTTDPKITDVHSCASPRSLPPPETYSAPATPPRQFSPVPETSGGKATEPVASPMPMALDDGPDFEGYDENEPPTVSTDELLVDEVRRAVRRLSIEVAPVELKIPVCTMSPEQTFTCVVSQVFKNHRFEFSVEEMVSGWSRCYVATNLYNLSILNSKGLIRLLPINDKLRCYVPSTTNEFKERYARCVAANERGWVPK